MKAIYEPRGAALEYAFYACNPYNGCAYGCAYCYVPGLRGISRERFQAGPKPRTGILQALEREAPSYRDDPREILLSFTSDPYQPIEEKEKLTRRALEILAANRCRVTVLTKNPELAVERDGDLFLANRWRLGTTITGFGAGYVARWEPGAPSPLRRLNAIRRARARGIETWVSVEPVTEIAEGLCAVTACHSVDHVRVGKLNHVKSAVDWKNFAGRVIKIAETYGIRFAFKTSLYPHLPEGWLAGHCPECGAARDEGETGWPIYVGGVIRDGGCQACWEAQSDIQHWCEAARAALKEARP